MFRNYFEGQNTMETNDHVKITCEMIMIRRSTASVCAVKAISLFKWLVFFNFMTGKFH